jgi:hypothetical protein
MHSRLVIGSVNYSERNLRERYEAAEPLLPWDQAVAALATEAQGDRAGREQGNNFDVNFKPVIGPCQWEILESIRAV